MPSAVPWALRCKSPALRSTPLGWRAPAICPGPMTRRTPLPHPPPSANAGTETGAHGVFLARVLVTCEMVQALVKQGDMDEVNSSDPDHVGEAIAAAARRGLDLT